MYGMYVEKAEELDGRVLLLAYAQWYANSNHRWALFTCSWNRFSIQETMNALDNANNDDDSIYAVHRSTLILGCEKGQRKMEGKKEKKKKAQKRKIV